MATAYVTHELFSRHEVPGGHPECPQRLAAIEEALRNKNIMPHLLRPEAAPATRAQIERVHTPRLIDQLQTCAPAAGFASLDPDTFMGPDSLDAAWHAAGAGILATRLVVEGKADNAFCAVRPPGHHAQRDQAMGFCLFNNVAVAAASALGDFELERVAILDFDVHHGNGTEDICAGDERVLLCSSFQHPFYPFSGSTPSGANIVNVPLPAGTGSKEFRKAIETHWLPAVNAHEPQLIYVSAGFDGHREDNLANFMLSDDDYDWITRRIMQLADDHCEGRIVSCLEGGYALDALGRCVSEHIRRLAHLPS